MSYERLTKYDGFDRKYHVHHISFQDLVDRLAELEDKIEHGDLIDPNGYYIENGSKFMSSFPYLICKPFIQATICDFCDNYDEAEAKLKELKENKHD